MNLSECIQELFSPEGKVSWSRVASMTVLVFMLRWINYAVFSAADPAMVLKSLPWYELAGFACAFYLVGKANESAQSIFGAIKK